MPIATMDLIERVQTTTNIVAGQRYLTWNYMVDGAYGSPRVVTVASFDHNNVVLGDGEMLDHPGLVTHSGRRFAHVNPGILRGNEYLVVEDSAAGVINGGSQAGDVVVWRPRNSLGTYASMFTGIGQHEGEYIATCVASDRVRYVRSFVALTTSVPPIPDTPRAGDRVRVLAVNDGSTPAYQQEMVGSIRTYVCSTGSGHMVLAPGSLALMGVPHGFVERVEVVPNDTPLTETEEVEEEVEEEDFGDLEVCDNCDEVNCSCTGCAECGELVNRNASNTRMRTRWSQSIYLHEHCSIVCPYCSTVTGMEDSYHAEDNDTRYCGDCISTCQGCGETSLSPYAEYCPSGCRSDGTVEGIREYSHTVPSMWLGGPLPKVDGHHVGFYIGFELEISSGGGDVTSLRDWAEEHMTSRQALDPKYDGSVDGFEIATQPMTPEFFESVDWKSFFRMLEKHQTFDTSPSKEPTAHGLHVHIGRVAFDRDDVATAMFCYLLGQGDNLERIGRRDPTHYCAKVHKPLSTALVARHNRGGRGNRQSIRLSNAGASYPGRDAINLTNSSTIEIRAFRSTRNPEHLKAAVRVVYLAAQYISHLRGPLVEGQHGKAMGALVSPKALHWDSFIAWVQETHPDMVKGLTTNYRH